MLRISPLAFIIGALASVSLHTNLQSCTRVVYHGANDLIITGRSMDWKGETSTDLWIFPRGMERDGRVGENPVTWVSRYGSVVTSWFDIATTDGINEAGLVANVLWLNEAAFPEYDGSTPAIAIST